MPLPPRDLRALHLALNPSLEEFHRVYPLSRYAPTVGMFKLYKMSYEGVPLVSLLDTTSWMTLACLDDCSADYCISHTVAMMTRQPTDRQAINQTFVYLAAAFMVPLPPPPPPSMWRGAWGQPARRGPSKSRTVTHVSETAVPDPALSATRPATSRSSRAVSKPSVVDLQSSVMRTARAIVHESGGKVDWSTFENRRLADMPAGLACKALRHFAQKARQDPKTSLDDVLDEFAPPDAASELSTTPPKVEA